TERVWLRNSQPAVRHDGPRESHRRADDLSMISVSSFLSQTDVKKLLADPSPDTRAATAHKVGRVFGYAKISEAERKLAHAVLSVMVRDAEARVRQALAESIKDNPNVPRILAMRLAKDVGAVATPILQFSPALTDEDLVDVIEAGSST